MKTNTKINISAYCNYNESFTLYDQLRQPNGRQELLKIFRQNDMPLEKQVVLEGGFGTGAYLEDLRHHVKKIYGVEGSDEGLQQALLKIRNAENVHLQVGDILDLGFSNHCFHGYMVNQVLHHLDTEPDFPNLNVFLKESRRVLKPGGILTIGTCSQEQLDPHSGVFWNYRYIEKAVRAIRARHIPIDALISRMAKFRFNDIQTTILSENIFHERYYHDPTIALEPGFQNADSVYCFLSREDSNEATVRLRRGLADGSVYDEMERAAERAADIGQSVIISARNPF